MTDTERNLIMDLTTQVISKEEFLAKFPVDLQEDPRYSVRALQNARERRHGDDVEYALLLGFAFGFGPDHAPILRRLLLEDWHHSHEDIVSVLSSLGDASAIDAFHDTALARFDYLSYDDSFALATKCIWALGKLGGPAARAKLELLEGADNPVIQREAAKQLQRMASAG